jgi:pilus assembly protein CpaC
VRHKTAISASLFTLLLAGPAQHLCAQASPVAQGSAAPSGSGQGAQFQDSINELSVGVGKTILVDTAKPIARVAIGIGDVAVATAVSRTEIMVNGKTPGESSLIIWDVEGNRQFFNLSVRASNTQVLDNLEGIRRELRQELPQQPVRVSMENGTLFLRGTVANLTSADRAVRIASSAGKVVNLLDVKIPDSEPQILLKVRFASVDRSVAKQLGINLFNLGLGNSIGGVTTGQFSPPTITGSSGSSSGDGISSGSGQATFTNEFNLLAFFPGLNVGADIIALEARGLAEVLAEPNVLATNGKQASFLAGGQYPYPTVQGSSGGSAAVTIQFKDYGIRLNFIPTITPRGTIRLQVAPEVSALDYANQVQISGFTVPGISTRKVNTEVELADRQSFAIGGLLDNSVTQTFDKIPFLGDIPILGKFFQSLQRTKNNSELIVFVTPEIVAPISAGQQLALPNLPQQFMAPNSNTPMNTPDGNPAQSKTVPATMPVEKLVESMKPTKPLVIEGATTQFGGASGGGQSSAGTDASAQQ